MPSKSKQQQKFMGIVRAIQKGEAPAGKFSKAAQKAAKSMKKSSVRKYAKTKHDDLPKKVKEEKKRDYKAEYKKFQSSTKSKKYRAELNKYNRKKGTYGNGDGKDASHKGGKIVGFESQSKNRGRAEKSRLKKESQLTEFVPPMSVTNPAAYKAMLDKQISKNVKVKTALSNKGHKDHKKAKGLLKRFMDKFKKKESVNEMRKFHPKKFGDDYMGGTNNPKGDTEMFADKKGQYYVWVKPKGKKERYIDLPKNIKRGKADDLHRKIMKTMGGAVREGFGGDLKGAEKKKFEKARKENAEVLGYKLTGKGDIKESVNESKAEKEKIFNMLVKRGDTPVDARYEVDKSYDFVKKRFSKASVAKKAEIISRLSKMESVNEANNIDKIKDIVKNKQYKRIGGVIIDMQTANAIMKVHKALTGSNKKKYEKLSISKMASIAYKLIK